LDLEHLTQYQFKLVVEVLVRHQPIRVEEEVLKELQLILETQHQQPQQVVVAVVQKLNQEQMLLVVDLVVVEVVSGALHQDYLMELE
jgi:hypothetical protein